MTTITATCNGRTYTAVYVAPECTPLPQPEPWTPAQLHIAMVAVGWRPLAEPWHYIHCNTFYEININKPDKHGDPDWLNWAVAQLTPPPF